MSSARESAALVALLRLDRRPWHEYAEAVERAGSALAVLEAELIGDGGQGTLLPQAPEPLLAQAAAEIDGWRSDGLQLLSVLDGAYPPNLRTVHDRPPVVFVPGAAVGAVGVPVKMGEVRSAAPTVTTSACCKTTAPVRVLNEETPVVASVTAFMTKAHVAICPVTVPGGGVSEVA